LLDQGEEEQLILLGDDGLDRVQASGVRSARRWIIDGDRNRSSAGKPVLGCIVDARLLHGRARSADALQSAGISGRVRRRLSGSLVQIPAARLQSDSRHPQKNGRRDRHKGKNAAAGISREAPKMTAKLLCNVRNHDCSRPPSLWRHRTGGPGISDAGRPAL
jgi:hypothetical protein